jgi:double-stranded uracil-DNA glycosylase
MPIPDLVAPRLRVLFCGINPGLWSEATGQHFARPGNRFWKVLYGAGFTDELLLPAEQQKLLSLGVGITNLVDRATAGASDLTAVELRDGATRLGEKLLLLQPTVVAFLGMQAYRVAFRRPHASVGLQPESVGPASAWLLPNPSGAQARYQMPELIALFIELRQFSDTRSADGAAGAGPIGVEVDRRPARSRRRA